LSTGKASNGFYRLFIYWTSIYLFLLLHCKISDIL